MTEREKEAVNQWNIEMLKKDIDSVKSELDFALKRFILYEKYPEVAPIDKILPKVTTGKVVKMTALQK